DAHIASSDSITFNVVNPSSIQISSSPNPGLYGHGVTLSGALSPANTTGSVSFFDGVTPIGAGVITSGGNAAFTIALLSPGMHRLTATYSGSSANGFSTSTP